MKNVYYSVTFDGFGSTSVRASTPDDAVSTGQQFARSGNTNVRITTSDAIGFTVAKFQAAMANQKDHHEQRSREFYPAAPRRSAVAPRLGPGFFRARLNDNGRWACKAGCGIIVDGPPLELQFLPRANP